MSICKEIIYLDDSIFQIVERSKRRLYGVNSEEIPLYKRLLIKQFIDRVRQFEIKRVNNISFMEMEEVSPFSLSQNIPKVADDEDSEQVSEQVSEDSEQVMSEQCEYTRL